MRLLPREVFPLEACLLSAQSNSSSGIECVHCPDYVAASAATKEAIVMDKIRDTDYGPALPPSIPFCDSFAILQQELDNGMELHHLFDRFSDERANRPRRFFHFQGIVAAVQFVADKNAPFTGMIRGAEHGVLRFSLTSPPIGKTFVSNHIFGTKIFSFALKLFRSGTSSAIILMGETRKAFRAHRNNRRLWDDPNFTLFSRSLDNLLVGISDSVQRVFGEHERYSGVLSQVDTAAMDAEGNVELEPIAPVMLDFVSNSVLKQRFGNGPSQDFRVWATKEGYGLFDGG